MMRQWRMRGEGGGKCEVRKGEVVPVPGGGECDAEGAMMQRERRMEGARGAWRHGGGRGNGGDSGRCKVEGEFKTKMCLLRPGVGVCDGWRREGL